MFCTKCGFLIKDGYKFCPKCGTLAYVEQEKSKGEVNKEETGDVAKDIETESTDEVVVATGIKDANNTPAETISNKEDSDSISYDNFIPNPLVIEELDIEGVKNMAEQGNKIAMLRQALRYEIGIGVEVDKQKADELFGKAGGRELLSYLEYGHINHILPDSLYDTSVLPLRNEQRYSDNIFKVFPLIRDVLLDYNYKVETAKSKGLLTDEKSKEYKGDFVNKFKRIRNLYPEFVFAKVNEEEIDEEINDLLSTLKEQALNHYSLKWLLSPYNFVDYIDGNKIEIPSLFEIKQNGMFSIKCKTDQEKSDMFNHLVISLLLQIPPKKIRIHFVDLQGKFEYESLLRQLDPQIYCDNPITSDDQLMKLLGVLEQRRLEVKKDYGDYSKYCESNKVTPIPYEIVCFFDKSIHNEDVLNKMCSLYPYLYEMGVYFICFEKIHPYKLDENEIFNIKKKEIYTTNNSHDAAIYEDGIVYCDKDIISQFCPKTNIILLQPGPQKLVVVKMLMELFGMGLRQAKNLVDSAPVLIKEGAGINEAETIAQRLRAVDAICDISEDNPFVDESLNPNSIITRNEKGIKGYGNYEVHLRIHKFSDSKDIHNIDSLVNWVDGFGVDEKSKIKKMLEINNGILLKTFPTRKGAQDFINSQTVPTISCKRSNRIRFIPYYFKSSKVNKIGIALYVPRNISDYYSNYREDLCFYCGILGIEANEIPKIVNAASGNVPLQMAKCQIFPLNNNPNSCIIIEDEHFSAISYNEYYGFILPKIIDKRYDLDFGLWGYNEKNSHDRRSFLSALFQCNQDINEFEQTLHKQAIAKWGVGYSLEHLAFSDVLDNLACLEVKENIRKRIPILKSNLKISDGLVSRIPFIGNASVFNACINYINKEFNAKDEQKVISLSIDYDNYKYDVITNEILINVGKKGKDEMRFRMDLVSHVHSFIIGQSGSGKSVFLHNIIGGAMLKYAPEDLQLYLLDFKLGGVEFNRYQGAKHVKALLVDNSDPQVTLEILRELRGSMTERGKLLRSAGVNNIGEYNKLHQEDRMPHVLVVADECHEMFKADDSIPRQVRNEISDIVIKIAKEGRSQGVHLVFATQTLSGTEISSEIINNVSDFYLLKCAQTDSERLVPNSSTITSELSTGQIYYHHVDEQVKFQAYYTDKDTAEKLMAAIVEKAKEHKSNGEFYFNGAQMFYLDESLKEQMLAVKGKSPQAFMGKAIDISQNNLYIKLNEDFSENVLLLGLNDQEQVTRTTMNLFVSLMMSAKLKHKDIAFKVIDCLNNEEGEVHELIFDLENAGYCEIIERRQRSKFFKELAQSVLDGTAEETILLILGQDRFRELKMDMELEENISSKSNDDDDMMSISDDFFGDNGSSSSSVRTYREALNVILDKGPDYGVHTLLQLEKASNLLFEDYITPKVVFQKFKHLVMLKSDETAGVTLHLNDDIRLEKLSSDWERLRAYYYSEESDSYTLFTPYMPSKSKEIINLLKTI